LKRIREAKRALEQKAREEASEDGKDEDEAKQAKPEDKAQYNFTDPESRIMKGPDSFVQAFNTQIAVEQDSQLIVGQAVTQETNDKKQVTPMVDVIQKQAGQKPAELLADSGYCSENNLKYLQRKKNFGVCCDEPTETRATTTSLQTGSAAEGIDHCG